MKKIYISVLTLLFLPVALIAGFNLGLINTAKKRVNKVDEKVTQSKATVASAVAPPDTQAPTVPTNLTATTVSWTQINLAWTASTDNIGVTSYRIYRDGGPSPIATPTDVLYSNTGLVASTAYSYTVSACDVAGNCSAQSAPSSATTSPPDTQAPTIPANLTATTASSSQINLNWTASTDNVGITGYKIYRDGGVTPIATPTGTSYSNTGLTASTSYSYTVSACDAATNCSAQSAAAVATTADPPGGVFLLVPGNATIGTSDFYVMKYEAKNIGGVAVSTPSGTPWIWISQTAAKAACVALGSGAHLLTLDEAQTISRNIENIGSNWSGGTVGGGGLWWGHQAATPAAALEADITGDPDDDPYVGTGESSPSIEKRTLQLSTVKYIWDWSGNVWEWLNLTCTGGTGVGFWDDSSSSMYYWLEWNSAGLQDYERGKAGPSGNYTSTQNVGMYGGCDTNGNAVMRGGSWWGSGTTGVFAFNASMSPSSTYGYGGFRCAR